MAIKVIAEQFDKRGKNKSTGIEVLNETIAASGTATSDDIMPFLNASEGYHWLQVFVAGDGTVKIEQTPSADGETFASAVKDSDGLDVTELLTGLTSSDNGKMYEVRLVPGYANKLVITETGGADSITVSLVIPYLVGG
jgi:hypothetical protein